jgi:general secretion pathway protein G
MNKNGFTIIEVLVVIVILGLLATFMVPKIMGKPDEARIAKAKNDIQAIESALKMYKLDSGYYPTTEQGLEALIQKPSIEPIPKNFRKGGYLETSKTPLDPWDSPFIYRCPGENDRDYEIISLGADRVEGGEDYNTDIKSYELR